MPYRSMASSQRDNNLVTILPSRIQNQTYFPDTLTSLQYFSHRKCEYPKASLKIYTFLTLA